MPLHHFLVQRPQASGSTSQCLCPKRYPGFTLNERDHQQFEWRTDTQDEDDEVEPEHKLCKQRGVFGRICCFWKTSKNCLNDQSTTTNKQKAPPEIVVWLALSLSLSPRIERSFFRLEGLKPEAIARTFCPCGWWDRSSYGSGRDLVILDRARGTHAQKKIYSLQITLICRLEI